MAEAGEAPLTPTQLASAVSISLPYASQVLSGSRKLPTHLAIRIFRKLGVRLGPIAAATDAEIEVLEKFSPELAKTAGEAA